jgi:hypothetical protein
MEITPVLPFARQKFPPHMMGDMEFFVVFLTEPLANFCRTLVRKKSDIES